MDPLFLNPEIPLNFKPLQKPKRAVGVISGNRAWDHGVEALHLEPHIGSMELNFLNVLTNFNSVIRLLAIILHYVKNAYMVNESTVSKT